jgi:hypothetical protein
MTADFIDLIAITLQRKQRLDRKNQVANNMASYDRWLIDAVELLLQLALHEHQRTS